MASSESEVNNINSDFFVNVYGIVIIGSYNTVPARVLYFGFGELQIISEFFIFGGAR